MSDEAELAVPIARAAALVVFPGLLAMWAYASIRARRIVIYMRHHHAEQWKAAGEPKPGLGGPDLQGWSSFLSSRRYETFSDPHLTAMCEAQRRRERLVLLATVAAFVAFGGLAAWFKYFAA